MAARRLLAAMLIFLAISTVLAALAPRPTDSDREPTTTRETTQVEPTDPPKRGMLVQRRINLDAEPGVPVIEGRPGDQLVLTVNAPRVLTLESPQLGITETTGPDDPARLDLFLAEPGRYSIRAADSNRRLIRILVRARQRNG